MKYFVTFILAAIITLACSQSPDPNKDRFASPGKIHYPETWFHFINNNVSKVGQEQKYVYRILKNRQSWSVPTDLRIGKHLDRLWAVLGLSSAQNQRFTSFFDTAWTLFSQNTAKVYCSSGIPPRVPGWRPQKSSAVREISPRIRMRCRKIVPRPGFSPEMRTAQLIHSVRAFSLETWPGGTK